MTQKNETSRPTNDLTEQQLQESQSGSVEPIKDNVSEESNWQAALQKKVELIKQRESELEELKAKLKEREDAEKAKRLAEMSEADRYREIATEEARRRGELELKLVVSEVLHGKDLPPAIAELIKETPWALPPIRQELGDDFTWDEAVDAVKRILPEYVDTLVVRSPTPEIVEEQPKKVDSERSIGTPASSGHIYTKSEVDALSKDPREWEKHRESVLKQLQRDGGVLPQ